MKGLIRKNPTYRLDALPDLAHNNFHYDGIEGFTDSIVRRPLNNSGLLYHYAFVYGFDGDDNLLVIENNENGVECVTWEDFMGEASVFEFVHYERNSDRMSDIINRAKNRAKLQYEIGHNNCEHFVNWCLFGIPESGQAEVGKKLVDTAISFCEIMFLTNSRVGDSMQLEAWDDIRSLLKLERAPEFQRLVDECRTKIDAA